MYIVRAVYNNGVHEVKAIEDLSKSVKHAQKLARCNDTIDCWVKHTDSKRFVWDMIHDNY